MSSTPVPALIDTNVLVYRYDARFPDKQAAATRLLRDGVATDTVRLPHQAIVEFVAAVTRPIAGGTPILDPVDARRESDGFRSIHSREAPHCLRARRTTPSAEATRGSGAPTRGSPRA